MVSDETIHSGEVSRAIARTNEVSNFGRVTEFRTGQRLNDQNPSHYQPVHKPDSIVIDYVQTQDVTYYRAYRTGESDMASDYLFRSQSHIETQGANGLKDRYAIPDEPDTIAIANVPGEEVPMRTSTAGKNDWGSGGGKQYIIMDGVEEHWFVPSQELTELLI